jgi:hypothetical protein
MAAAGFIVYDGCLGFEHEMAAVAVGAMAAWGSSSNGCCSCLCNRCLVFE